MRLWRIALGFLAAGVVADCGLFFPSFGMSGDAFPSAAATYTRGKATVTILTSGRRQLITLDRVSPGPHLYTEFGAEVRWLNDDGWALALFAPAQGTPFGGPPSTVWIDHVAGNLHLTTQTFAENRCIIDVTKVDATAISGTATCKGLRWTDALASTTFLNTPQPVASEPPFDAEIVFEASP
jgi:hypothetical protein